MARLTIPDEQTFAEFTVVTSTTAFPITFSLFAKADLTVKIDGTALDQSAFTFTGTLLQGGGYDGGTVTLNEAVDDVTVRIERNVTPARTSNFAPSANTPVGNVDQALNRATAILQDHSRRINTIVDDVVEAVLDEIPVILEGLDLRRPFGGLWLHDYAENEDGVVDGNLPMFIRAKAAGLAADKPVYMLPGTYTFSGTPEGASGLLEQAEPGTPWFICATGNATLAPAASTSRAIVALSGGGGWRTDNIIYDATNVTSNFAIKNEDGGDFKSSWVKFIGKGMRWVGDVGRIEIDCGIANDVSGHGFSSGSSTGEAFGSNSGGWVNLIVGTNVTKSDFNWAATRSTQPLSIGTIIGRWPKFEDDGTVYPTKYAACRIGNGSSNVTVKLVIGEGKYRAARLTDTDTCTIETVIGVNTLGPTVLCNSKDQVARGSGVGRIISINACRNLGRTDIVDDDGEGVTNEGSVAVAIAEGENWFVGGVSGAADEYLLGLGSCLALTGSVTLTNRDYVLRGQDFNCFDDVQVGDLIFDATERPFARVSAVNPKVYYTDAKETTTQLAASGADHATQTITLDAASPRTDATGTGTITVTLSGTTVTGSGTAFVSADVGRNIHNLAGDYVGRITAVNEGAQTVTLATGGAKLAVSGAGYLLSARYRYRTPDAWFFTTGTGNATCTTASATLTVATTQLEAGDLIFNDSRQYVGEVLTVDSPTSLTLTANAARNVSGAAWQFGRPKKVKRAVEIANTATATNINRDNCYIRGAVDQFYLDEPEGIRPTHRGTINLARLARMDATVRRGERWYISDMTPAGWVTSTGVAWRRENNDALQTSSATTGFTLSYLSNGPLLRLTGDVGAGATATITLPTAGSAGLPNGAIYTISSTNANTGTWEISNGSVLTRLRGGQWATVIYDGTGTPVWRLVATGNQGDRIPRIMRGSGTPEATVIGDVGDHYVNLAGTPGTLLYIKETGAGTNTGWVAQHFGARTSTLAAMNALTAASYSGQLFRVTDFGDKGALYGCNGSAFGPVSASPPRITYAAMTALTASQHTGQTFCVTDLGTKPVFFHCNGTTFTPMSRAEVAWANRAALAAVDGLTVRVSDVGITGSDWIANGTRLIRSGPITIYANAAAAGLSTALTGTIANTKAPGFTSPVIPGGVLNTGDSVEVMCLWQYTGTAGTKTPAIYFTTTDSASGLLIANGLASGATSVQQRATGEAYMVGTASQVVMTPNNLNGNNGASTSALGSSTQDSANPVYCVATCAVAGAADTAILTGMRVRIM